MANARSRATRKKRPQTRPPAKTRKRAAPPGLTRRELAKAMGVVMQTVTKWEARGMPVLQRGRKGKPSYYDLAACEQWKAAIEQQGNTGSTVDVAMERARKERAQAAIAEQLFQQRANTLLPREETERQWEQHIVGTRNTMLTLAQKLADGAYQAGQRGGVPGLERFLADAFETVLREWAAPDLAEAVAS